MTRLLTPFVLLVPVAVGCANDGKSGGNETLARAKADTPAYASTEGQSRIPATPQGRRADRVYSYVDSARQDLSDGKVKFINQVMRLSREESAKFWPIYHDYEEELFALGDRRVEMTRSFVTAQTSQTFDDAKAASLAKDWFDVESQRLELLKKYHDQIATQLSALRAVQFAQIEHRFGTVIDLMIASELPLVRTEPAARPAAAAEK